MKKVILVILCLVCFKDIANAQDREAVLINHAMSGGDRLTNKLIGYNKQSLLLIADQLRLEVPFTRHYVLKRNSFDQIKKYVNCHCDTINRVTASGWDFFQIKIIKNNATKVCYLDNKGKSRPYFTGLLHEITKAGCQDCDSLKKGIELDLKNLAQ